MKEKIVETKQCKQCNISFEIIDKDLEFYEKVSPIFDWKKYNIPTPTLCPDCRQQRRLTFRNEKKLYKRKCNLCNKNIISIYSPDKNYKIFCQDCWWSDKWDSLNYWEDFDFNKTFFEQYRELFNSIPQMPLITNYTQDVNSDYSNYAWSNKNCYMTFNADFNEDCIYLSSWFDNKKSIDCFNIHNSENCYECVDTVNSFWCK